MSFILGQILVCLLLAGLIGAIIGWLLRGGCSRKLRDCEDEWKMKLGSLESDYSTKLQRKSVATADDKEFEDKEIQAATLKRHAEHVESQKPTYSYEQELQEKLNLAQNAKTEATPNDVAVTGGSVLTGAAALGASALTARNISLDDDKVALYAQQGIDFETAQDLEDDYAIHSIEGINAQHAEKLKTAGITSTKDLTKLAQDANASEKVAKELNVDTKTLESWIGKSCLLALPGVNTKTAQMMHNAGITSNKMATSTPEALHQELQTFSQNALIPVSLPDSKSISLWSKIAKPVTSTAALAGVAAAMTTATKNVETKITEHHDNMDNSTNQGSDYAKELQSKLNITPAFDISAIKDIVAKRNIHLSDEKIKLYAENGIDFEKGLHLEDNYDVQAIEGVGSAYAQHLKEMGISTTQELVAKLAKNNDKIDQVAKTLKVDSSALTSWISMADLIQLPGVDGQAAELMQTVGISTARELGITNANSLHNEMVSFNQKSPIIPEVPSAQSLGLWSKIAKLLG